MKNPRAILAGLLALTLWGQAASCGQGVEPEQQAQGSPEREEKLGGRGGLSQEAQGELPVLEGPEGFTIRALMRPTQRGIRVTGDPTGRWLYVLGMRGRVERFDTETGVTEVYLKAADYLWSGGRSGLVQGICFDEQRRLYLVANVRSRVQNITVNQVTIYRSKPIEHGGALRPAMTPWLEARYPWGGNQFNHGAGNIAQGPDGMIYVGSGSRTDADEDFDDPNIADGGEVTITSCIWRLDPQAPTPKIEVYAQGLRNAFGFDWDADGQFWATDNGPNKHPPGELNVIEQGRHYGFPYRFSDWQENPYAHAQEPPKGLVFELPVLNVGPDAGGDAKQPLATFEAHSSPNGLAYLGKNFPESVRGALAVVRFGNLLGGRTVGYDLLLVRPQPGRDGDGRRRATVTRWAAGLVRPLDVYAATTGRLYVLEYAGQPGKHRGAAGHSTGRLLEICKAN